MVGDYNTICDSNTISVVSSSMPPMVITFSCHFRENHVSDIHLIHLLGSKQ